MNKFNHSAFLNDIKTSQIFMDIFKITNVEEAWNAWIQEYQRIINLHAPCRKIRLRKRNNPWISRFIQTAIYQRDSLHKEAIKSKCPVVMQEYRKSRNHVTHTIKKIVCLFNFSIINTCIQLVLMPGIVPMDLKIARVTPVFKNKGQPNDVSNYRPISVTSHFAKILEDVIKEQLVSFLTQYVKQSIVP